MSGVCTSITRKVMPMPSLKSITATLAIIASVSLCFRAPVLAESLPHFSVRELVCMADQIVLCEPLDDGKIEDARHSQYTAFKVIEVLSGPVLKAGTVLRFKYAVGFGFFSLVAARNPAPKLTQAILFLRAPEGIFPDHYGGGTRSRPAAAELFWSSQRFLGEDQKVYAPVQHSNPGDYELREVNQASWERLLARLKEDIKAVNDAKALFKIEDAAQRNAALFDWIEKHKQEFKTNGYFGHGAGSDLDANPGWSVLQSLTIRWIAESGIHADAWKALLLHHDLDAPAGSEGSVGPQPQPGSFSTKIGRQFLMTQACDAAVEDWHRILALSQLEANAFRPPSPPRESAFEALTDDERAAIMTQIPVPLRDKAPGARGLAAKIMRRLIAGRYHGDRTVKLDAQIKALVSEAYVKEPPGDARRHMAQLYYEVCDAAEWKSLTGNPDKRFAYFRPASTRAGSAVQVHLHMEGPHSEKTPALFLERLAQDGTVANKMNPEISNIRTPVPEGDGTLYQIMLSAKNNFEPGTYRIVAASRDGEPKWRSEAAEIVVKAANVQRK